MIWGKFFETATPPLNPQLGCLPGSITAVPADREPSDGEDEEGGEEGSEEDCRERGGNDDNLHFFQEINKDSTPSPR